ncbi:hypothetical protein HELRODRAFT_159249 [Helobdella robusta]|uniref:Uncharacterized protein n=1 Tax=Helobdella robusta TaxID=6412 RepID=T1ENS9_HELRO|nr:hypothetical protein HELRODRAFT_159249 [Helobdella robusta]ESO12671.1 hypothetical protein HELRODRAFT_159249 [Helobdella robusta]
MFEKFYLFLVVLKSVCENRIFVIPRELKIEKNAIYGTYVTWVQNQTLRCYMDNTIIFDSKRPSRQPMDQWRGIFFETTETSQARIYIDGNAFLNSGDSVTITCKEHEYRDNMAKLTLLAVKLKQVEGGDKRKWKNNGKRTKTDLLVNHTSVRTRQ